MALQKNYEWLSSYPLAGIPIVSEALKLYGTTETPGPGDNPVILGWAQELGIADYKHDETPWCGLFMAYVATKAHEPTIPANPLYALNWRNFGSPLETPLFGDVLVFKRMDKAGKLIGGHVGVYIGEDEGYYHVLGGNESDSVTITRMPRVRLVVARRSLRLMGGLPDGVKRVLLPPSGQPSTKEV